MDRRLRNHIARHNITSYEVEQALYTHPRLAVPGREDTTEVLGITTAGRHLLIVTTEVLGITTPADTCWWSSPRPPTAATTSSPPAT